ncbi:glycine/D-amino acid oxidase-like deaminating enzyme [Murinocardiopsis flavida]|uniref:Glycine/D-amino acid oxidase-like deaminating enzyme n=1 Tax=Murinocardiopsis flavida TaxID=645275 RepID=A0A2P8DQX6_9ACTN|nr:FAD-binding oxidoreductase [Murinocardiopsis flavida]PSK99623.1 glycine/D-amino acid oxidase-like deaminating enzyme [Murinocardiopsis flavida]
MHIAVIGAGAVGLAIARELVREGARVTVLERRHPGAGTSATSFAWINAHLKRPASYQALNRAGLLAHHALHNDLTEGPRWFVPTGNLEWAADPAHATALTAAAAAVEEQGGTVERLTADQARALEPGVRIPAGVESAVLFADEGYVLPGEFLGRLLTDAIAGGAELRAPAEVRAIDAGADGARITLADGTELAADAVVTAVGRWTEPLLADAGVHVPMADPDAAGGATVGYLAYTAPAPVRLNRVLTTSTLNVRPDGNGRLVLQGLDLDPAADPGAAQQPGPGSPVARTLRDRLAETVVGGEYAEIEQVRVGQRALPADGLTVCGFTDDRRTLYTVATHSGITLAPALAPMVAAEVLGGSPAGLLADFRPTRFTPGRRPGTRLAQARLPGEQ